MKFRDFFSQPKLHAKEEPLRLLPGRAAVYCDRECGNYLVVPIPDLDKYAKWWTCPACEDAELADHFNQLDHTHTQEKPR